MFGNPYIVFYKRRNHSCNFPNMNSFENIISILKLRPHPEGGYFRESYRSAGEFRTESLDEGYAGKRNYATCIYFLLTSDSFSAFHRIRQDEIWHFYEGSPINLHMISPQGVYSQVCIGRNLEEHQHLQYVVPGETWFAAKVINDNDHALVGCTVSPGFDFADFTLAQREELLRQFPQHSKVINELTRE